MFDVQMLLPATGLTFWIDVPVVMSKQFFLELPLEQQIYFVCTASKKTKDSQWLLLLWKQSNFI